MLRLGLDLDGVFVDWTSGFRTLLVQHTGVNRFPPGWEPTTWYFWEEVGYSQADAHACLERTMEYGWWRRLGTYHHTLMLREFFAWLASQPWIEVTFITSRPSPSAREESIEWLAGMGHLRPQVIISRNAGHKASIAKVLQLDAYFDDHIENCLAVADACPNVFLVEMPYNRGDRTRDARVKPVPHSLPAIQTEITRLVSPRT